MSTMIAEVYEALKAAEAPEDKAAEAAKAVAEIGQEHRIIKLEGDLKLIKWMLGVLITMNIGIILMLIKVLSSLPK